MPITPKVLYVKYIPEGEFYLAEPAPFQDSTLYILRRTGEDHRQLERLQALVKDVGEIADENLSKIYPALALSKIRAAIQDQKG